MNPSSLDEAGEQFLTRLHVAVKGDPSGRASMYEIGEAMGLDRDKANFVATELMSFGYVEIKSLSGGIGITAEGLEAARALGAGGGESPGAPRLGDGPVLEGDARDACDLMTAGLKSEMGKLGLDFDAMSEMGADLKTIDAQMNSPRPKTVIVRECFRSIRAVLQKAGAGEPAGRIGEFIG